MKYQISKLTRRLRRIVREFQRRNLPRLRKLQGQFAPITRAAISYLATFLIGLLWLTFVGYIRAWQFLQPIIEDLAGRPIKNGHRALFCVFVSAAGGSFLMTRLTPIHLDLTSFFFWVVHGLLIHGAWERGEKWCRRRLGFRPAAFDPAKPYDGLDLGN